MNDNGADIFLTAFTASSNQFPLHLRARALHIFSALQEIDADVANTITDDIAHGVRGASIKISLGKGRVYTFKDDAKVQTQDEAGHAEYSGSAFVLDTVIERKMLDGTTIKDFCHVICLNAAKHEPAKELARSIANLYRTHLMPHYHREMVYAARQKALVA